MCGEMVFAKTDACLLDVNSEIFLLVQEDKTHINPGDPGAQLIAAKFTVTADMDHCVRFGEYPTTLTVI